MYDHSNGDNESSSSMGDSADRSADLSPKKNQPASTATNQQEKPRSCSYCSNEYLASASKHVPFCSRRCQQIDLGMWLNESYGLPYEGEGSGATFEDAPQEDE